MKKEFFNKMSEMAKVMAVAATLAGCQATTPVQSNTVPTEVKDFEVMDFLRAVVLPENGIGAREAGTEKEQQTADFVYQQLESMGYAVSVHKYSHPVLTQKDTFIHSSNIIADRKGRSDKVLVLGAHFDSTGSKVGSQGAMDNGAGLSVMLAVANHISQIKDLPYSVRFVAFGAEEIGKVGSRAYLKKLAGEAGAVEKIAGMINLDTVAGGDFLYVHSAHTTPYKCGGNASKYSSEVVMRKAVLKASKAVLGAAAHQIHPPFPGYPEGVTGDWSDHEPFACHGVPIAYIETTNFAINGKDGYDGYSQSISPGLWDCFDADNVTACDRDKETQWGRIWHSGNDQLKHLQKVFPGRIEKQLQDNVAVLNEFFAHAGKYVKF